MSQTFLEDIPEFLEIQRNSFLRVLDTGLIQALEKINPIVSTSQSECGLLFYPKEYVLVLPENTITEAFLQGKTYGCKIYVPAIIYEKEKKNISNSIDLKSWSYPALGSFGASGVLAQKATSVPLIGDYGLWPKPLAQDFGGHNAFGTKKRRAVLRKHGKKHGQGESYTEVVKPSNSLWSQRDGHSNISENIEKPKQVNPKVQIPTKTLGSALWPVISANAWPRIWPVSYKGFNTKDIKNNLFQGERGYGVLVGPKGKASKGVGLVPRDHKALASTPQAKGSTTKRYFSPLFISIGCADAGTKKSLWVKNNGTWSLGTVGSKRSPSLEPTNATKREQSYSPNKNQNHLVVLGAKGTRQSHASWLSPKGHQSLAPKALAKGHNHQEGAKNFAKKGQVLLGAKGTTVLLGDKIGTKTTIKNRGYFTFGLSFLSFGHFLRNLMCNSTLPKSFKINTSKTNLRFFSEEGAVQQERDSNQQNDQIPFGLSKSSAYLNKNTNLESKVSLPSWSSPSRIYQEQATNFVHGPKADPLQLLRSFERRSEKSHTSLQLKDFLKRTNKHFIDSSKGVKGPKIPLGYNILSRKPQGEQSTKDNFVTSLAKHACAAQGKEQVILKNTLRTNEKKLNPLSRKEWVCIGVLPLMTPRGHFIINGSHRIIVSQMGRAPGLYYQIGDKLQATIVPAKGAWLRMSVKENDNGEIKVWVRITPQRKIPYKIFIETYKYLENLKSPENPQFKFLNLTYKSINSKIKHFDKHYAIGVISGQIQRTLLNFASYNLGTLGRKRINERLSIKEKKGYLTSKDISLIKRNLLKHLGQNPTAYFDDDIDHLQNRRVRTCGELLQSEIEVGMARLKKTASKQLEDYANSNLSIIEKGSFQLKPKPLSSNSLGSKQDLGQKPVHPNDNKLLATNNPALAKPHLAVLLGDKVAAKQDEQRENFVPSSYPVAKDFNRKMNEESTKSSVILSQELRLKVLAQKPSPFLVSVKNLRQSCTSWSFKRNSLRSLSMLSVPLRPAYEEQRLAPLESLAYKAQHASGTKKGYLSRYYYGPWTKPLTIPGSYLARDLEVKAHKDSYGQELKPLFMRRSHHQKNGSLILSSWFWSLQQEDRPLEQPRLLPLGHSLSWWRSRRQIRDTGIYRGRKYQNPRIPLQSQDLNSIPVKKSLSLPFRVGVNLLSSRAYTKALNSSWVVDKAPKRLSIAQEGVGDYGLWPKPLAQDFDGHDIFGTKNARAVHAQHSMHNTKPKAHGLWSWWRQSRLALLTKHSTGFGHSPCFAKPEPRPQIQGSQVLGKGTYQIKHEEQLHENLREVPKLTINKQKSDFSFAGNASGTARGSRSWLRQNSLPLQSTEAPTFNLEKSKQKKWSPYKVISTKAFAGALREFFGSNPLSQYMDQTNPLAEITHKRRLSSLGPGGVDRASAGIAIRGIHPSHYGRICPIETPEGKNAGLVNSMTMWARVNQDGFLETPYLKVKGGSIMSHTNTLSPDWYFVPTKKETRAFPDVQLSGVSSSYSKAHLLPTSSFGNDLGFENQKHQKLNALEQDCTTSKMIKIVTSDLNISESSFLPNISIPTRDGAERSFERAKRAVVSFCGVSPTQNISVATSLIPFLEHDDATRALMGSNMQRQAVPLLKPQGPLVRTGLEGKVVGESGHALQAICSGVISTATRTLISIETFQKKDWSNRACEAQHAQHDQHFGLKESCSLSPQTYINANKSLSFLRTKSNHSYGNTFGFNFGTMPPLLCTSLWGNSGKGVYNLGGCDLTPKLPILKILETLKWKGLRLSAFKIKKNRKEKKKKLQTTFYNYTFGPKEYTYETAVSPRHNNQTPLVYSVALGANFEAKKDTAPMNVVLRNTAPDNMATVSFDSRSNQPLHRQGSSIENETQSNIKNQNLSSCAVHAKHSMHLGYASQKVATKQAQAINFNRVAELINQYNFISVDKNVNSTTSVSRYPLGFQNDGYAKIQTTKTLAFNTVYTYQKKNSNSLHRDFCPTNATPLFDPQALLCHNMSKNFSRKSPLIERKTKTQKLQEYARSNQATICVQRPAVKAGDWVQKGDLIGDCSASVNGVLSLGKNIVVAYLPMEGFNFEDAIVVSDRLVHEELYTSIHVQRVEFDMDAYVKKYIPKKIKIKKQKAAYKTTGQDWITKHNPHLLQTEKELLNPLGIIKVGSWVGPGDVLVSKVVPVDRKIAPSRHLLLAVFQEKRTKTLDTDDTSLRVPKGIHGRVINVKVVGNGTVIPLNRKRFSLKKTISTKRDKLLPFFSCGNKAQVGVLTGSEEPLWPLAKFDFALPLAPVVPVLLGAKSATVHGKHSKTNTMDFRLQNHGLQGPGPTRLQSGRPSVSEAPKEVILVPKSHKIPTSAEQNPLKSRTFDLSLRQLRPKGSIATISKTSLRQDLFIRFPNVPQNLKENYAAGVLNILHQLKKSTNSTNVSIDSYSRAFAVAKKAAFFPSFGGLGDYGLWPKPLAQDFGGQAKDLSRDFGNNKGLAVLRKDPKPKAFATGQNLDQGQRSLTPIKNVLSGSLLGSDESGQPFETTQVKSFSVARASEAQHAQHGIKKGLTLLRKHAKKTNSTDTDIINLELTKQNKGYLENAESLSKPITLEKKKIDGEYKIIQVRIYIAERKKLQVGDKMSGRHGNKGIVSTILPREDMPFLPDGTSVDMVLNPLGIPSRMNVGQVFECLLGLASSVCGEIIGHTPFDEMYGPEASRSLVYLFLYLARLRSRTDWLFQPNFPGKTIVFDGRTGMPFEQWVTVGRAYMLKLIHMVDEKIHARSIGPRSLVTQQPVKGRARGGGQRLGEMELWALEGFGAAYTLQEILTLKSDDIRGRENVENSIIFSTTAKAHIPETFRMMLFELRCLCLNVELN